MFKDKRIPNFSLFSQNGRSMIEMLAVLAIMGILTIGGIAGYTFAISKHRANQIYKQVDLRANASFANAIVRQTAEGATYALAGFDEVVENITEMDMILSPPMFLNGFVKDYKICLFLFHIPSL